MGGSVLSVSPLVAPRPAVAQVEEIRLGVTQHNIRLVDGAIEAKEEGPNIEGELVFAAPKSLAWLGDPRPYMMASYNPHGGTSWAGGGLYWSVALAPEWRFEPGFGYVLHNGELDTPYPAGDPRNRAFADKHVLLGSRDLFRTTLALERRLATRYAAQIYYEHLSHGQILGRGRNQGMDELGLRIIVRLDEAR